MTPEQKTSILAAITAAGLDTAGDRMAARELNSIEIEGTVVSEEKRLLPKPEILAMLSDTSLVKLLNFFETREDQARAFEYRWDSLENLDLTHPVTRGSLLALQVSGIFREEEVARILRHGERSKTKADVLVERLLTSGDITEARS